MRALCRILLGAVNLSVPSTPGSDHWERWDAGVRWQCASARASSAIAAAKPARDDAPARNSSHARRGAGRSRSADSRNADTAATARPSAESPGRPSPPGASNHSSSCCAKANTPRQRVHSKEITPTRLLCGLARLTVSATGSCRSHATSCRCTLLRTSTWQGSTGANERWKLGTAVRIRFQRPAAGRIFRSEANVERTRLEWRKPSSLQPHVTAQHALMPAHNRRRRRAAILSWRQALAGASRERIFFGSRSIASSSARAGASGCDLRCSQSRSVVSGK